MDIDKIVVYGASAYGKNNNNNNKTDFDTDY